MTVAKGDIRKLGSLRWIDSMFLLTQVIHLSCPRPCAIGATCVSLSSDYFHRCPRLLSRRASAATLARRALLFSPLLSCYSIGRANIYVYLSPVLRRFLLSALFHFHCSSISRPVDRGSVYFKRDKEEQVPKRNITQKERERGESGSYHSEVRVDGLEVSVILFNPISPGRLARARYGLIESRSLKLSHNCGAL